MAWKWLDPAEIAQRDRGYAVPPEVWETVRRIIARVRVEGDAALRRLTLELDGVAPDAFRVAEETVDRAYADLDLPTRAALETAARRIAVYQERTLSRSSFFPEENGVILGEVFRPLAAVGIYVPGGRAPLPSTVLMTAVPARVAGVERIALATPPRRDGSVHPAILAAARIAGVTEIYRIGGAQAVAAFALGTESVPRVDKVVGPGNVYVTTAKQQVFGLVGIDLLAGLSEVAVLADEPAEARWLAADLMAQGEHDPLSAAYLITPSRALGEAVAVELARLGADLPFPLGGGMILVRDVAEGLHILNRIAPEHCGICLPEPWTVLGQVRAAGSIFLGHGSPQGFGDYLAGPSHVLPTGATARFSSPLTARDFQVSSSVLFRPEGRAVDLLNQARHLAETEGLAAHALALRMREEVGLR